MIHMVWMMRFEETHQSVNLKENSSGQISLPLSSRQTKERGGETGGGFKAEQNQLLEEMERVV